MVHRLRLISAIAWTLVILVLCWTPDVYLPEEEGSGWLRLILPIPIDKIVHVGIFAVFTVLWLRATGARRWSLVWIFLAGIALAVISELGQNLPVVNRDGEWQDGVADSIGVLLGFPAFTMLERWLGGPVVQRNTAPDGFLEVSR